MKQHKKSYADSIVDKFCAIWYAVKVRKGCMFMKKDTSKIVEELGLCASFSTFYDENKDYMVKESLNEMLKSLVEEKGL